MSIFEASFRHHRDQFGETGTAFAAPGRVNLIGEHTDYTGGLVLPMAIQFQTVAVLSPRKDSLAHFYSANLNEHFEIELNQLEPRGGAFWGDYAAGVAWSLGQDGVPIRGFNLTINGDVPLGAGLSSSASVEVGVATGLSAPDTTTLAGPGRRSCAHPSSKLRSRVLSLPGKQQSWWQQD